MGFGRSAVDRHHAAVHTPDVAFGLQFVEIPTHGGLGHPDRDGELIKSDRASGVDDRADALSTLRRQVTSG